MTEVGTDVHKGLKDLASGFIRFSIKATDTKENEIVHKAFKEFCKFESDDNYTLGLKRLLEIADGDAKFEAVWEHMKTLEDRVLSLEEKLKEPVKKENKEEDEGVF